jgi:hypothetical protein
MPKGFAHHSNSILPRLVIAYLPGEPSLAATATFVLPVPEVVLRTELGTSHSGMGFESAI